MNPNTVILSLLADLQSQILALRAENEKLRSAAEEKPDGRS